MTLRSRAGARIGSRLVAATLATALPLSLGSLSVVLASSSVASGPAASLVADESAESTSRPPYRVAPRTTIAGTLQLRTKRERHRKIKVTSSKGSHTWTASSLAEHDLPSAAMRAYKHAARKINASQPGCHLPWTCSPASAAWSPTTGATAARCSATTACRARPSWASR